ncbi:MAG TPA: VWA domain-containing protein [Pyrinomonadaceae bacterium]
MKIFSIFLTFIFAFSVQAQTAAREFDLKTGGTVEIKNLYGRVSVSAEEAQGEKVSLTIQAGKALAENEVKTSAAGGKVTIFVNPDSEKTRVDLTVKIPLRARVKVETGEGEVRVAGELESAEVTTDTGTISTDVPLENLKYNFQWTASRPRYLSDVELEEVREKSGGRFSLSGKLGEGKRQKEKGKSEEKPSDGEQTTTADPENTTENEQPAIDEKPKTKDQKPKTVSLNFTTTRGIVLLNVNPNEVPNNLQQRPLTEAAKAIIRSGDSLLTEAIRRASPKHFGDYAKTLPPLRREPTLTYKPKTADASVSKVKRVTAKVVDANNRAISGLQKKDFTVLESGKPREILAVETTTAPFNLVLLLDVSGSVENYVDFIRKAARNFINTVDKRDRIAIVAFNEDIKVISNFTTDRARLSESLDTFDAGGGTGYYDALAFSLVDTLRPLKGERTAIVVLSDGDDNRSFLSFESLLGSIQESGALVYPLYVPSGLIAASAQSDPEKAVDPLRTRYMGLTTKAEGEGARLAQISGGIYYPIRRLAELQKAYDDIVLQLRTAYTITFRSDSAETGDGISPRLRVRTNREGSFVNLGAILDVSASEAEKYLQNGQVSAIGAWKINYPQFAGQNRFLDFNFQNGEISGEIEKVNYRQFVNDNLREYKLENFDVNKSTGAFLLSNENEKIAVSRWISPKRTRSYPYERVYDTLAFAGKKVTIIPVVKDEGLGGERDFLQWDTVSLLSLLDVHVILAFYSEAEKNTKRADQITGQKFDNNYILARLKEVSAFQGTPRRWNERETKQLKPVFEKARAAYREISKKTNTYLHDETALNELITYAETPQKFIDFSRRKAQNAQGREFQTLQPKEALSTDTKGKVTITNALFGKYFFTVDETKIEPPNLYLIEAKHSQRALLPSKNDIKDGLIKMMLYTNLSKVKVGARAFDYKVMIRLTSSRLKGSITSDAKDEESMKFFSDNFIDPPNREFLKKLFQEARENKFTIILEHAETAK